MKLRAATSCFMGAILLSGIMTGPVAAGNMTVYVIGFRGEFGTLDLSNPSDITFNSIKNMGIRTAGMGFTSSGSLYLLDLNFTAAHLLNIDPTNGNFHDLGAVGDTALGATMGLDGKTMYAIDQNSPAGVYSLTPPSTTINPIGPTSIASPDGLLAFSPKGTLYTDSFNISGDALYSIDRKTGQSTPIGTGFGAGIGIATGLFLNGTFFGFGGNFNDNSLDVYTINTSTGLATVYGTYSLGTGDNSEILGVALAPSSVPEPSTLLMGIASIVLMGMASVWGAGKDRHPPRGRPAASNKNTRIATSSPVRSTLGFQPLSHALPKSTVGSDAALS